MLDVAAHMLLLQRQAQIKHERPHDESFLPLSLTVACLLRQLPTGLAPPTGTLSLHEIDKLPLELLDEKLVRLLEECGDDDGSGDRRVLLPLLQSLVLYVKTSRALLGICHEHLSNQRTASEATQALVGYVVDTLAPDQERSGDGGGGGGCEGRGDQQENEDWEQDDDDAKTRGPHSDEQREDQEEEDDEKDLKRLKSKQRTSKDRKHASTVRRAGRRSQHTHQQRSGGTGSSVPLPPARHHAAPPMTMTVAVDPSAIMKRALARDVGDGSAIIEIMRKYGDDLRIQAHGVRALKSVVRKFPHLLRQKTKTQTRGEKEEDGGPRHDGSSDSGDEEEDQQQQEKEEEEQQEDARHRRQQQRDIVQLVLVSMRRAPDHVALQRDALFCLLDFTSQCDANVAVVTSLGGIVSIMEAMARLPDDEESQIAALSILGNPVIAEHSVLRVDPQSRRLVLSAMRRFPLSERLQGLSCLALTNLSLRQDESMQEIVASGGLVLVVTAMTRFSDVSLIQAAGSWLLSTVSGASDAMLVACLEAGALPVCEKARVRFAQDPRVQQHAVLAIQSLVRDVPSDGKNDGDAVRKEELSSNVPPTLAIVTPDEPSPPKTAPVAASTPQKTITSASVGGTIPPVNPSSTTTSGGSKSVETETQSHVPANAAGTEPTTAPTLTGKETSATTSAAQPGDALPPTAPVPPPLVAEKAQIPPPAGVTVVEVVHERYVGGRGEYLDDDDFDERDTYSSFEIEDSDADDDGGSGHGASGKRGGSSGGGKRQNYASLDAGATILDSSPEMKSPTNLLVPDKDRYMLMPCEKPRKWVVVSLSEDVHADAIAIANFEKFSSTIKEFIVLGSVNYPTDTWFVLGNFTAAQQNGEQIFPLDAQHHVRYIKLRFFSHYGSEYYCTLSQIKMYGRTFTQVISQLEKSIDAEANLDTSAQLPTVDKDPYNIDGLVDVVDRLQGLDTDSYIGGEDTASELPVPLPQQCSLDEAIAHDRMAMTGIMAVRLSDITCSIRDAPKQSPNKPTTFVPTPGCCDSQSDERQSRELADREHDEGGGPHTTTPGTSNTGQNTSTSKSNGSASAIAVAPSTSQGSNTLHAQGLGRLESIFVRITKKIQQLEFNQSLFTRQLEDTQAQQKALSVSVHAKHDALAAQMKEMRALLMEMRTQMDRDTVNSDQYRRLVDELIKENTALWNEMLIVREVITTMKAGILCALVLSACIIVIYLLRLLFRCVKSAKRRADQREWFWRMETLSQQITDNANSQAASPTASTGGASGVVDNDPVGSWRVNYKKQFGSSWDDSAIERKTLLRELVDEPSTLMLQTVDGRQARSKRARTASLVATPTLKELLAQMEIAHAQADVKIKRELESDHDA